MSTLTWLHLSDLHFRADEQHTWDENIVLQSLLKDVAERMEQDDLHPDFIVVTGDIAFSGKAAEYDLARHFFDELLEVTALGKDRLILVPGNHDVDLSCVSRGASSIAASLVDRRSANEALATPADRQLLLARFEGYLAFVGDYLGNHLSLDDEGYFYICRLDLAGQRVAVLGLNSAWLARGGEEDRGRLLIGERQAHAALERAEGADLKIAVLHHPFEWLRDFDRGDSQALLVDNCDFVLHGHMHQVGLLQAHGPDSNAFIVAAGACYQTRQYPNSYNLVQLNLAEGIGTVHLRMYSDRRGGFWTKDVVNYRNASDGVYEFALDRAAPTRKDRRVDAAVPSQTSVNETIDLLVQVRFPGSPLLRITDWLFQSKPSSIENASESVYLTFPVDPQTGKTGPARLEIRVVAPKFRIEGKDREIIQVPLDKYSKRVSFRLTALEAGVHRIDVKVYAEDGTYLGILPVETTVAEMLTARVEDSVANLILIVVVKEKPKASTEMHPPPPLRPPSSPPSPPSPLSWVLLALLLLDLCLVPYLGWCLIGDKLDLVAYLLVVVGIYALPVALLAYLFVAHRTLTLRDALYSLGTSRKWAYLILVCTGLILVVTYLFCHRRPTAYMGLVVDNGPVTAQYQLDEVKTAAQKELSQALPNASLALRVFGIGCGDTQQLVNFSRGNAPKVAEALDNVQPVAQADIVEAIRWALDDLASKPGDQPRMVVAITRGEDGCGQDLEDAVEKRAKEFEGMILIELIVLGDVRLEIDQPNVYVLHVDDAQQITPELSRINTALAAGELPPPPPSLPELTIDNPHDGKLVDRLETAKGSYENMPMGWRLRGVTQNKGGRYYLSGPKDIPAGDGEWTLDAYFGDRTYGIGSQYQYFVIAVQADSEAEQELATRAHGSPDPLPEEGPYLYLSEPITVERVGPLDRWYASYWADTEMESGEAQFQEDIESQFIFKYWGYDAPDMELSDEDRKLPKDNWSARFVRRVHFPQAGPYRFYAERDDGVRVWIDGEFVIDAWDNGDLERESQTVTLTQGYHEIAIAFFDSQQTAQLGFWYEGPEPPLDPPAISTSYWRVDYYPNQELKHEPVWYERRQSDELDIPWGDNKGTPIGGQGATEMLGDYFSTRSTRNVFFREGLYQFEAKGDDGIRFKVDDQVILEESEAWQNCNPCRRRVDLTEGQHTLVMEQWDTVLNARVSLEWEQVSPAWESLSNPYTVRAMAVDDHYVWTGGEGGLVRWNKNTLSPEILHSESGLPDNMVNALLVDQDGTLWVGTGEGYDQGGSGLGHYDGEFWQTLTEADGLCEDAVHGLFQDEDRSLWVGTSWGLGHYDLASSEWRCYYKEDDGLGSNYPIAIHRDSQGELWVSVGGEGVSVLQIDDTWKTYASDEIDTDWWGLEPIAEDGEGNLWFGSWGGAYRYDGQGWKQFTKDDGLPTSNAIALVRDDAGNMWFGTSEGVARYDGETWQVFTTDDGLASNYVTGLVIDRDGVLWAGHTGDVGLSRFDGRQWVSSPVPEGTSIPNRITSIYQDRAGKLWFGTGFPPTKDGHGVYTLDGTTWETFDEPDCLTNDYIDVIFQDKDGNLWFGYDIAGDGVTRFDGEMCQTFTTSDGLAGGEVDDILQDPEGYLWFGTSDGGISRYDGTDWTTFDTESGLPTDDINAVYQDSADDLWFGTRDNGVVRYDGEGWAVFTTTHGLTSNWVTDIVEDTTGRLWVGTGDGGIGIYDLAEGTWDAYQEAEDGLLSNTVYTMNVDKSGWVWVGTPEGVSCYTGRRWLSFTPADGLASRHVWTIWEDERGNLWFGTGGGSSQLQFVPTDENE